MSAPFYPISTRSDPAWAAPIHMYYGADDPNYSGGSAAMLQAQWTRLGVPSETDVQTGYGHSTWPPSSIAAGLSFLLAQTYPGAPTPSRCGDVDAPVADVGPLDAGVAAPDAPGLDAARADASSDAGPRERGVSGGCACAVAPHRAPAIGLVPVFFALGLARARRRPR